MNPRDEPEVPATISDEQMHDLRRRAQKADREPWTSDRAVARRINSTEQNQKRRLS